MGPLYRTGGDGEVRPRLAIDASGSELVVYLGSGAHDDPHAAETRLPAHSLPSEGLAAAIAERLGARGILPEDLGAVVVTLGPGSFTGLRVALATAKGLCMASGVPLFGTSSLAVRAASAAVCAPHGADGRPPVFAIALDARRGDLFGGAYAVDGAGLATPCMGDVCLPTVDLAARVAAVAGGDSVAVVGDAAQALADALCVQGVPVAVTCAPVAGRLLVVQAAGAIAANRGDAVLDLLPRYLRASAAEPAA